MNGEVTIEKAYSEFQNGKVFEQLFRPKCHFGENCQNYLNFLSLECLSTLICMVCRNKKCLLSRLKIKERTNSIAYEDSDLGGRGKENVILLNLDDKTYFLFISWNSWVIYNESGVS